MATHIKVLINICAPATDLTKYSFEEDTQTDHKKHSHSFKTDKFNLV